MKTILSRIFNISKYKISILHFDRSLWHSLLSLCFGLFYSLGNFFLWNCWVEFLFFSMPVIVASLSFDISLIVDFSLCSYYLSLFVVFSPPNYSLFNSIWHFFPCGSLYHLNFFSYDFSLSLSLSLSLSVTVTLSLSLSFSLFFSLCFCKLFSFFKSLSFFLSLLPCLSLYISLSFNLNRHLLFLR